MVNPTFNRKTLVTAQIFKSFLTRPLHQPLTPLAWILIRVVRGVFLPVYASWFPFLPTVPGGRGLSILTSLAHPYLIEP